MSRRMERSLATLITVLASLGVFDGPPGARNESRVVPPSETTEIVETTIPSDSDGSCSRTSRSETVTREESSERRCVHEALVDRAEIMAVHDEGSQTEARN